MIFNVAAKEFVPPSPTVAAASAAPASPEPAATTIITTTTASEIVSPKQPQEQPQEKHQDGQDKQALSVRAPEFVPRVAVVATPDRPCEPLPGSATAAPATLTHRSGSTVSSSVVSRTADCCGEEEEGEEEEAGAESSAGGYGCGEEEAGVLAPEEVELYEEGEGAAAAGGYGSGAAAAMYSMPYRWEGGVPYNGAVYYDAAFYDPYSQGAEAYGYWPATDGVYDEAVAAAQYWGTEAAAAEAAAAAGGGRGGGGGISAAAQLAASDHVEGLAGSGAGGLGAGEARELLELFFPHYAGAALSRLLERTGGDLAAAFAELAAMERQLAAERTAERAAGGGGASTSGRGQHGQGGKAAGAGSKGAAVAGVKQQQGGPAGRRIGAFKLDSEAFPTLAGSSQPAAAAAKPLRQQKQQQQPGQEAADEPAPANSSAAPSPSPSPLPSAGPSPAASPAKLNFAAMLRNSVPSDQQQTGGSGKLAAVVPAAGRLAAAARTAVSNGPAGMSKAAAAAAVPWVSTGAAVAAQYSDERAEAAVLARARNAYFMQATLAFLGGDKAVARQLARKGRAANEAMKAAHAAAAARIFAGRNQHHHNSSGNGAGKGRRQGGSGGRPEQQQQHKGGKGQQQQPVAAHSKVAAAGKAGGGGGGGERVGGDGTLFVDLHGLHAKEAVAALEAQIEAARAAGCRHLRVCTGTGHHTKGAKTPARLPTVVAETLLANHLTFRTLQPGLLEAAL